jgi:hypothetical protein
MLKGHFGPVSFMAPNNQNLPFDHCTCKHICCTANVLEMLYCHVTCLNYYCKRVDLYYRCVDIQQTASECPIASAIRHRVTRR